MSPRRPPGGPRRRFLRQAAAATAGFAIVPRRVPARSGQAAPSDRLTTASVGRMGRSNLVNLAGENIVALCDVASGLRRRGLREAAG